MTSSLEATGNLALPLKLTADLIAASAEFQTLVGADDADEALGSIYEGEAKAESLPRCIIDWSQLEFEDASTTGWNLKGVIAVLLEKEVSHADYRQYQDEGRRWRNQVGQIALEMMQAMNASPHLYPNVTKIDVPPVELPDPDERAGDHVFAAWLGLMVEGSAL